MFNFPFLDWFSQKIIVGGDWRFFWPENIGDFVTFPTAWDASLNTGLGSPSFSLMWINTYLNFTAVFSKLGLSWNLIGLLFWMLPAIALSFFSAFYCFKYLFPKRTKYGILAGIIYLFNTYFLMVFTGGQLGISLAYSIAPFVFLTFTKSIDNPTFRKSLFSSLVLGLQMLFDPRLVYITFIAIFIYWLFNIKNMKQVIFAFVLPFLIGFMLHSYWIVPLILTRSSSIQAGFTSLLGLRFFSFSDFSHSLSFLHPNWPENIFGKVYFLKPEFLLLPILAFSSLLFIKKETKEKKKNILFFAILGLLGAFLAKGASDPFGITYEFAFRYIPGFVAFRDPTKFYLLISLSYSMLIPFAILSLSNWISLRFKMKGYISNVLLVVSISYVLVLASPVLVRQFNRIATPHMIPNDYVELKNFLGIQPQFFRTLWIPSMQRFGFFSNNHPAISGINNFNANAPKDFDTFLSEAAVQYVIVPYDSEKELFLKDRKYDEKQYDQTVKSLRNIEWLKKIEGFGKIAVFENSNYKDHFWSRNSNLKINYKYINSTKYYVDIENSKKGDVLVFSEGFDKNWQAQIDSSLINSKPYDKLYNSFVLSKGGSYTVEVVYSVQKWVNMGLIVSFATLTILIGSLLYIQIKNKYD
ncbi:MAG: hypothetical protein Q7R31_02925 [Candidatus Levybacteria bacterium]|nr:hypothetical protein [Candidatus Levybacteria bacterium]